VTRSGFSLAGGTVVSRSGVAVGGRYRRVNVLPSGIDAQVGAIVSVRAYQEYSAAIGWLDRDRSTVVFEPADAAVTSLFNASAPKAPGTSAYLDVRHRIYPRHWFYGSGMGSREDAGSDYTLSGTSIDGVWQRQFSRTLGVSVRGGWMNLRVGPGHNDDLVNVEDRFEPAARPGWDRPPQFLTVGAGVVRDGRDNPRSPEAGWFVGTSVRRFAAVSEADSSFTRATLDMRAYERLLGGVVAVRGLASGDLAADGATTPFYLLPSLGGPQTLRGFHPFRFADRALLHATAEFRLRVHRWIELAPFLDAGTVAPSWSRMSASSVLLTPGVGLRARTDRRALARLDWSRGRDGHRLTFGVGPVF
jgi:outer membrane protein assembly factor BamA